MSYSLQFVIFGLCCYLWGSINNAVIISKFHKIDIREIGSGNPGTLNMSRNLGLKLGLLTFLLDMLKGTIPVLITYFIYRGKCFIDTDYLIVDFLPILCGLCIIIGHIFPIYMKFKGGKGIATTIGVFIVLGAVNGLWILPIAISIICAFIFILFTELGAVGSFIAITPPCVAYIIRLILIYGKNSYYGYLIASCLLLFFIIVITLFAHRKNIKNIIEGKEHPTSIKEMIRLGKEKKSQK